MNSFFIVLAVLLTMIGREIIHITGLDGPWLFAYMIVVIFVLWPTLLIKLEIK